MELLDIYIEKIKILNGLRIMLIVQRIDMVEFLNLKAQISDI